MTRSRKRFGERNGEEAMFTRWISPEPKTEAAVRPFSAAPAYVALCVAWLIAVARLAIAVSRHETGIDPVLAAFAAVVLPAAVSIRQFRIE
jgi:hypothetical protein